MLLIAAAFEDGYAFVRTGECVYFLRPPYGIENKRQVDFSVVEKAIGYHGFEKVQRTFDDWSELIGYLEQQLIQHHQDMNATQVQDDDFADLLMRAPASVIRDYITRAENDLIRTGRWNEAIRLFTLLLRNPIVRQDSVLYEDLVNHLDQCNRRAQFRDYTSDEEWEDELQEIFPCAPQDSFEIAKHIREERCLLLVGSC